MRIYTRSGDLALKTFTFPDGQPHFKLETYERDWTVVTIETALKSPLELFQVGLAIDVLRNNGYSEINLDVRYLLAARMDRAIDTMQPYTLQSVARIINSWGCSKVRLLDVHSEVATRLIRNSENVLPYEVVGQVWETTGKPIIICPDKGAVERVNKLTPGYDKIYCTKERNPETGALSGFKITDGFYLRDKGRTQDCLIVDDICDGGGTFIGLAKELRKAGAKKVFLFVTHGIFSKGLPLEGIDAIYTTDSYQPDTYGFEKIVCIPVSMKEL